MKIVCITGGIGSGKSVVCQIFSSLGVPFYDADKAVHSIYDNHPEVVEKIVREFSDDVIDKNGKVNRKRLGELVFGDNQKLKTLNSIVHPVVKSDFENWTHAHKTFPYVIKEAAILFESGTNAGCEKIITVVTPIELRIARIKERDHKSRAETEQVIARQISDEEKIKKSDFVITNDESQLLIPQVLKIHSALSKE